MSVEVEMKFRAPDPRQLMAALAGLGCGPWDEVDQVDNYLAHPARDFAQTDEALRIRSEGQQNYLTYKGPKLDATTKTRREIEMPLSPGADAAAQAAELFGALGFRPVASVRK